MDRLKFKLGIVEALAASPPANKSVLTDDEDNSVAIPLAKRLDKDGGTSCLPWTTYCPTEGFFLQLSSFHLLDDDEGLLPHLGVEGHAS
ncbi:hypothetical protein TNCV_3469001 [Trichonephila clavipes]|nr:hypothetical protein TNCV_3469001 [Trichonephila clavipes]